MEPTSVNIFFTVLVGFAMVAALVGTILPAFPGVGLAWLAALGFGFLAGWSGPSIPIMIAITAVTLGAIGLSIAIPKRTTDSAGASRSASWAGVVGAIIGFFAIPVIGFVIGGAAGVYVVEYTKTNSRETAWSSTKGTLKGLGIAALIQVAAVTVIGMIWLLWVGIAFMQ